MGRHVDAAGTPMIPRLTAQVCGLAGGAAWLVAYLDPGSDALAHSLVWGGAALLTVAFLGLGLMLVRSEVLLLRLFVGLALPTLVWGVMSLVIDAASDPAFVEAIFGTTVAVISGLLFLRRSRPGATL